MNGVSGFSLTALNRLLEASLPSIQPIDTAHGNVEYVANARVGLVWLNGADRTWSLESLLLFSPDWVCQKMLKPAQPAQAPDLSKGPIKPYLNSENPCQRVSFRPVNRIQHGALSIIP
jgi:hypothetical protein